ncbi:MAG: hypothetical protein NVSMB55_25810 [Mycobacteriales bacterium]
MHAGRERIAAVLSLSLVLAVPAVASATAAGHRRYHADAGPRLDASHAPDHAGGQHGEKSEPTPTATPTATATATATPFDAEGLCTNILSGGGTSQLPVVFVPVLGGHLFFHESLGDGDSSQTPSTSCPSDAYTLTAYASRPDYLAGAQPLGQVTKTGDGSATLNFDVPLGSATVTSVCVVGTNGLPGTTTPVPATEPSPTTVERAPMSGCFDVTDGAVPGGTFH